MSYLTEAFKALDVLDEEIFPFDKYGADELKKFLNGDIDEEEVEEIIDSDAETEDELQKEYDGKVVLECSICHTKHFDDPQNIVIDETTDLVNVGQPCPSCGAIDGYKIIGQIGEYNAEEDEENADKEVEVEKEKTVSDEDGDVESEEDIIIDKKIDDGEELEESKNEEEDEERTYGYLVQAVLDGSINKIFPQKGKGRKRGDITKYPSDAIGVDDDGLYLWVKDEDDAKGAKKAAEIFGLSTKTDDPNPRKRGANIKFHILVDEDKWNEQVPDRIMDKLRGGLNESVEDVTVTTDSDIIQVKPSENGEMKIETMPKEKAEVKEGEEVIVPVSDKTKDEIEMNDNNFDPEDTEDISLDDVDIDELDTETFDELGESYLKEVYSNVDSFKTTSSNYNKGKLLIEGVISFKSGKKAKTKFMFECKSRSKKGKLRFIGENLDISRNRRAFRLTTSVNGKKGMCESLNYNYLGIDAKSSKRVPLYGTMKRKR